MAFYTVRMDLCTKQWQEAECVVKARSFDEALQKARAFDFEDINLFEAYDTDIIDYDKGEGIRIENILGGNDVYRQTN